MNTLCCSNHGSDCCGSLSGCIPRLSAHCSLTARRWSNKVRCSRSTAPLLWWLCGGLARKRSPNSRETCSPSCSIAASESVCSMLLANPLVVIHFLTCCIWCVVSPFLVVSIALESPVVVSSILRTVTGRCCGEPGGRSGSCKNP